MTTYNINGLKNFMIKLLGQEIIIDSRRHPNKNDDIIINRDVLLNHFTDNKIHDYAKKEKWTNDISLQKFIDFLINFAGSKQGSRSKYHEYMEFHPSLFNLDVDRGVPNYSKVLLPELKNKIEHKRDEYIPCFWLVNKIRNHTFLKNYLDLVLPKFQKLLSPDDARFYDIVFDKLGIVIEVQEDADHHMESENDLLKESLALCRDNYIMYFKMRSYREEHGNYLINFWNMLYDHILASIFTYEKIKKDDDKIRQYYVIHRFEEICANEIVELNNEKLGYKPKDIKYQSIANRINMLTDIIRANDNDTIIKKVFNWKKKSIEGKNKYCIDIDNILKMINEDFDDINIKNKYKLNYPYFEQNNDDIIYITWETMIVIVSMSDIKQRDKATLYHYLSYVEKIYSEICNTLIFDAIERKKSCNIELVEKHIKLKSESKYTKEIEKYKLENCELLTENKIHHKTIHKLLKSINDHNKLKKIINKFDNKNIDYVTINLSDHNQSIFNELPDFPIRYSCYQEHYITYEEFNGYCDIIGIKQTYRNELINQLFACKNNCHGFLSHLMIKKENHNNNNCHNIDILTYQKMMNDFNHIKNKNNNNNILLKQIIDPAEIIINNVLLNDQIINITFNEETSDSDDDNTCISSGNKALTYFHT